MRKLLEKDRYDARAGQGGPDPSIARLLVVKQSQARVVAGGRQPGVDGFEDDARMKSMDGGTTGRGTV